MELKRAVCATLMAVLFGCGGATSQHDGGTDAGSLFTGGGGGTSATGGGTGATGGGGGTSGFAGDACDNQRVLTLTQSGTEFHGNAISDTSLATASISPTCGQRSKDVVFKVDVPTAGALHVIVTPHGTGGTVHFDPVISLFTGASCAVATSAACTDSGAVDASETLIQQVAVGPVWVWISGADPSDSGAEFDVEVILD